MSELDLAAIQRRGTVALAGREVRRVTTLWTQTIVPPVLNAALYLLVFGGALGTRLREIEGVPYLSFILPGLLVMTTAGQAFANNATSIFQAKYDGYIEDVLSSPIGAWRLALGYLAGGLLRGYITALAVFLIAAPFAGPVEEPLLAVAVIVLTGLVFAPLGVITGIWAESFDQFSFVANLVIAPLALVAGIFYSVRALPEPWSTLTRLDPIFYLVAAARRGFTGLEEASVWASLAVAAAVAAGTLVFAALMLEKGWRLRP